MQPIAHVGDSLEEEARAKFVEAMKKQPKKRVRKPQKGVYLDGQGPIRKGMRIENNADGQIYKVTAVRPNGKITAVCKKTGKKATIRGAVIQ